MDCLCRGDQWSLLYNIRKKLQILMINDILRTCLHKAGIRELVNAVLYLVKTGCQWRNLPKDFPNWKAVSMFYYRAQQKGIWEKVLKMLVKKTRKTNGRNENLGYALIDSQSVKTTAASEKRGYDGEKNERQKKTYSY